MRRAIAIAGVLSAFALSAQAADAAPVTETTTSQATAVCQYPASQQATVTADLDSGMSAAAVCALVNGNTVSGSGASATPDEVIDCGTLDVDYTKDDPRNGWFHEEASVDVDDGYMTSGTIIAAWSNDRTGGGNSYTWDFAGLFDSHDVDRQVYSMYGTINAYVSAAVLYTSDDGDSYVCSATTPTHVFYVDKAS